jgi:LmbE family N-acetylglucosaminyl deacetylase
MIRRFSALAVVWHLAGCGPAHEATSASTTAQQTEGDAIARLDVSKLIGSCEVPLPSPPIPTYRAPQSASYAVAVYTAHPDDEAMYAGGLISALTARGHRVGLTPMSHGEGGRLLLPSTDGGTELVERRDVTWEEVARVRDPELAEAARRMGADLVYINEASERADYGFTTSCPEALDHWEKHLHGGLRGVLRKMVADIRRRRPQVVLTLDPRDDPHPSHHGHHKAVGVLAELSARLAADPSVPGTPHAVSEVVTMAPADASAIVIRVDANARRRALDAHASQFWPKDLNGFGMRPEERFVVRWRATGAPPAPGGTVLFSLLGSTP